MTDLQIYNQIHALPPDLKKEAEDFIEFLAAKNKKTRKKKKRKFGILKGKIIMLPGFDDPLDDFKEYM